MPRVKGKQRKALKEEWPKEVMTLCHERETRDAKANSNSCTSKLQGHTSEWKQSSVEERNKERKERRQKWVKAFHSKYLWQTEQGADPQRKEV